MESRIIWPYTEGSRMRQKDLGPISYRAEIFKETAKIKVMYVIVWNSVWF